MQDEKELELGVDSTVLFDATGVGTTVFLDTLHYGAYGIALSFKSIMATRLALHKRASLGHHKTDCAMEIE